MPPPFRAAQHACDRRGLDQLDLDPVAKPIGLARAVAHLDSERARDVALPDLVFGACAGPGRRRAQKIRLDGLWG
jgi:hypothetical protein